MTMQTEQPNPNTRQIDQLPTLDALRLINAEDARVAAAVEAALPEIAQAVDAIAERLRAGGRLIYVGAGTSGRLGVLDAVECVPTFGTPPELVQGLIAGGLPALTEAAEGAEDDRQAGHDELVALDVSPNDAVVGIAASGRTPYVLGALDAAREVGALRVGIACNTPAPLLDAAEIGIAAVVGPEVIAGSTRLKAGTAQKLILNMISTATMIRLGKVYGNRMVDVKVTNQKLAGRARRLVAEIAGIDEVEAGRLLGQTGNRVKPAVVMALLGLSAAEAQARLDAAQGVLAEVIGPAE
ncbi:N-acetylmuramic acid 6-phosphate etherase [Aggregatilinea lenta]|uniref:N-acetylmuramic acid 6-phosphate etherase n=1 Tax=Aggregatilinea lenta TaxID=913108 RepID=UPI000E5C37D3|nr:N-acetylmuramic acid 6-phosphate etherase [Aggregatilinea lenta]